MPLLNTKLRRDLLAARWQAAVIAVTTLLGIGFFQGSLVSYANLGRSYDLTYRRLHFGDVWVPMAAAPDSLVRRVAGIPGVRGVTGRLVKEIRVGQREGRACSVVGRIISMPTGQQPAVNRVAVVEGRYFSPQGGREVLLERSFAQANHYRVGDYLYPTVGGEEIRFRVVGLVQSAEYIYAIQSEQYLVPTPDTFGVLFLPQRQVEALVGMPGMVNEITVTTAPGRRAEVVRQLGRLAERYGGEELLTRDEQPSNKLLQADLDGYRQIAVIFPLLFLTAAVLTTYTLLARLVQAQRAQIGVLRAMGFPQRALWWHYLWLAIVPSLSGGVLGVGLGYLFAWYITRLYVVLINVPFMAFEPYPAIAAWAVAIAGGAGLAGACFPARQAAAMPPAVAMTQQEMSAEALPAAVRRVGRGLPLPLKMPVRNLVRRPLRTVYTVLGLALGVALVVLSFGILDSVQQAMRTYFEEIQRYDLSAGFVEAQPGAVISQVRTWPGVWEVEPTLDIPIEIRRRGVVEQTVLSGLPPGSQLRRFTDAQGTLVIPAPGEALLGDKLRERLGVRQGDLLRLDYAQNRPEFHISRMVVVGPPVSQPIGSAVHMRLEEVRRLFGDRLGYPPQAVGGVLIWGDTAWLGWWRQQLCRMPQVAAVESRQQLYDQIQELLGFTRTFVGILAFFGVALAFAVVFTAVSITVLERSRELATLRTLGFQMSRIAWLTTVENMLVALLGILMGLPLGRYLDAYLIAASESESVSLEPVIFLRTYLIAITSILVLTAVAQVPGLLHVRQMNLATEAKRIAE